MLHAAARSLEMHRARTTVSSQKFTIFKYEESDRYRAGWPLFDAAACYRAIMFTRELKAIRLLDAWTAAQGGS